MFVFSLWEFGLVSVFVSRMLFLCVVCFIQLIVQHFGLQVLYKEKKRKEKKKEKSPLYITLSLALFCHIFSHTQ